MYCEPNCITAIGKGLILNDTTFVITSAYRLRKNGKKKNVRKKNATYHFKQFALKPDSTNRYVK